MRKSLTTMITIGLMAGAAVAQEKARDVAKLLKDQLIAIEGGEVKAAQVEEGMDYYLVYHSASW